jgi:ribonuclease VapC
LIVVDTSALIAVIGAEAREADCAAALSASPTIVISAGTLVEYLIVTAKPEIVDVASDFIRQLAPRIHSVDADFAEQLGVNYQRWGRGFHPAKLNMGDCYAYTLAQMLDVPLLYIGKDFSQTDVRSVLADPSPGSI